MFIETLHCVHMSCFHVFPVFTCPYLVLPVPVFVISLLVSVCVLITPHLFWFFLVWFPCVYKPCVSFSSRLLLNVFLLLDTLSTLSLKILILLVYLSPHPWGVWHIVKSIHNLGIFCGPLHLVRIIYNIYCFCKYWRALQLYVLVVKWSLLI